MILAGDIGGTNARLALFDVRNGQFNLVTATIFPSRNYSGLDQIVNEFVQTYGIAPPEPAWVRAAFTGTAPGITSLPPRVDTATSHLRTICRWNYSVISTRAMDT